VGCTHRGPQPPAGRLRFALRDAQAGGEIAVLRGELLVPLGSAIAHELLVDAQAGDGHLGEGTTVSISLRVSPSVTDRTAKASGRAAPSTVGGASVDVVTGPAGVVKLVLGSAGVVRRGAVVDGPGEVALGRSAQSSTAGGVRGRTSAG
jgi:hypothetical protein